MINIPIDKQLHIIVSMLITLIVYVVCNSLITAILATVAIGVAKEIIWDYYLGRGTPDKMDIVADIIGIVMATGVVLVSWL